MNVKINKTEENLNIFDISENNLATIKNYIKRKLNEN